MTDTSVQLAGNPTRILDDFADIKAMALNGETKFLRVLDQMTHFSHPQQCLGGNAAPIETDPAQMLSLNHHRLQTKLSGPDRCDISARAAAEHGEIIVRLRFLRHFGPQLTLVLIMFKKQCCGTSCCQRTALTKDILNSRFIMEARSILLTLFAGNRFHRN